MLTVVADSTATVDADTDLMHHTWNWGDGTSYFGYDNLKAVHTYDKPGTYNVILTVTDPWDTPVVSTAQTVTVGNGETENLALYMTFDDLTLPTFDGVTRDCSSNAASGSVPAGITGDALGVRHSAAVFTAGPSINITTPAFNTVNGELSLYANVKLDPAQNAGWSVVASNKPLWESNYGFELQFVGNGNANIFQLWGSGADTCTTKNLGIKDGNWHQVGVIVNGTVCHIYVDGVDMTFDGVVSPIVGSTDPVRIGNNIQSQNGWYGEIDDLAIFKNAFMYYQLQGEVDKLKSCQIVEPTTTTTGAGTTGDVTTTGATTTTGGEATTTGAATSTGTEVGTTATVTTTTTTGGEENNSTSTTGTEETTTGMSTTTAAGSTTANEPGSTSSTGVAGSTTGDQSKTTSGVAKIEVFGWTAIVLVICAILF